MVRVMSLKAMVVWGGLALVALGGVWSIHLHQQGRTNARVCASLDPGISRHALVDSLGRPSASMMNPAGTRLILSFGTSLWQRHTIRAILNVRDDRVVEIDCGGGQIKTSEQY